VTKHVSGHGVLIDNVIASGASSAGAIRLLTEANIAIAAVGCVSVDLDAGSSRFIQRRGKTWDFNPFSAECPRGDLRHG
jgi:adenine/guanine phosphoribosyltransferase-like PRPP-binding protein